MYRTEKKRHKHITSFQVIIVGFFSVILLGSLFLMLPWATQDGQGASFGDALFTSTSAVCVTGLILHDTATYWSMFGQGIILFLIQIGGMGVVTVAVAIVAASGRKIGLMQRSTMQEAISAHQVGGIVRLTKFILKTGFLIELTGAILLSFVFCKDFGLGKGIWYSVFHSISAFCNAGFDVLGSSSLIAYQDNLLVNLTISFLIIAGGLGFVVWIELKDKIIAVFKRKIRFKKMLSSLSVHSKIVISMTCLLLISGTVLFFCLEYNNTLSGLSLPVKLLISFFQSVTLRTAGFASVNMAMLKDATKLFMCIYMFIGGSPAGTAGGIKTVTFAMILLSCYSLIEGNDHISVFKRKISQVIVKRALMISFISLSMTLVALMILSVSENQSFINLMFEVYSAFATVGLTAAVTPLLTNVGKLVVIFLMYIGRIGPITMLLIFVKRYNQLNGKEKEYPHGDVLIG